MPKTYKNLYDKIISFDNLLLAYKKARKGKTKKDYVIEFEKNLSENISKLQEELINQTYKPESLKTFILRDPKTRKISVSNFKDRIVHHALCRVIEPIFDKTFIYDSCANRKEKGNLFAINRFYKFLRKVSRNGKLNGWFNLNQVKGYCLKADIKHYFQEIDRNILLFLIKKRIKDEKTIYLIKLILNNFNSEKGMPLGNLTSQFFANVYLNELDYFVKHKLKINYYIRYVDDFVILHSSKMQINNWKIQINDFLRENLNLELHIQKSRIINLSKGIDFVGFRNFYYFRLLRKRNLYGILMKIEKCKKEKINSQEILELFQGWNAYSKWANSYLIRKNILKSIYILQNIH